MSCDPFYGHTDRTIQEQVTHSNFSLCVGRQSYFCAKSLSDLKQVTHTMMPLLQKILTTSEIVTLKVGIDLDGTIVRIYGNIDPSTIFDARTRNGISFGLKSNASFDDVSIILVILFSW